MIGVKLIFLLLIFSVWAQTEVIAPAAENATAPVDQPAAIPVDQNATAPVNATDTAEDLKVKTDRCHNS